MRSKKSIKQKARDVLRFITFLTVVFTIFPNYVYAYLDPGSGSYVIQILIASLAAVGFFVKTYWNQIKNFFNNKSKAPKDDREEKD